jgi:RHS repeat-associated protein
VGNVLWSAVQVNAMGRIEASNLANGLQTVADFEPQTGRLLSLKASKAGTTAMHHQYEWDSVSQLQARTDKVGAGLGSEVADSYSYDSLGRLVNYDARGTTAAGASITRSVGLQYNALGLLLAKSDVGNYSYPAQGANNNNRPHAVQSIAPIAGVASTIAVSYLYDLNGNANSATTSAAAIKWRTVAYNSFNLPDGQTGVLGAATAGQTTPQRKWEYDESHQRVMETRTGPSGTFTTTFLHPDNQGGLAFEREEAQPNGGAAAQHNRHYLSAGGAVFAVLVTTGDLPILASNQTSPTPLTTGPAGVKLEYWHKDHLGSLVATTDHAGTVTARYAYDPFGKRRQLDSSYDAFGTVVAVWSTDTNRGTPRGFTGHEHLDDVGLVHMNGRIFDPLIGRFMQADPMIQDPGNLQDYDRYGYCYNNPMTCTDPSGNLSLFGHKILPGLFNNRNLRIAVIVVAAYFTGGYALDAYAAAAGTAATSGYAAAAVAAEAWAVEGAAVYGSAYSAAAASVTGGMVGGAAGGFAGSYVGSGGDFKAGLRGALTGALSGGINNYYGSSYPATRVVANGAVGGMGAVLRGDSFSSGFRSSAMISALAYLNVQMREEMIAQSRIDSQNDGTGYSRGMNGDGFKLAGGRWYLGEKDGCSMLGCWQNGPGSVFGRAYSSGGFIDMVTESFAGPHDKANSYWWYVNTPQQVLENFGMVGDALPSTYYTALQNTLLEYATNYSTSLLFAMPFASAAIVEQSWSADALRTRRR